MARGNFMSDESGETMKKAMTLAPNKKSGKDKHTLYRGLNQVDDDDELDDEIFYHKKESILDYFDE